MMGAVQDTSPEDPNALALDVEETSGPEPIAFLKRAHPHQARERQFGQP